MVTTKRHVSTIDEAAFAKASKRGHRLLARGPLAIAARYEAGRIHVELNNGCAFEFPVAHAQGLAGAKATELRTIKVSAAPHQLPPGKVQCGFAGLVIFPPSPLARGASPTGFEAPIQHNGITPPTAVGGCPRSQRALARSDTQGERNVFGL